jgi:RimJ/RimL family protein N-acetyltransferase
LGEAPGGVNHDPARRIENAAEAGHACLMPGAIPITRIPVLASEADRIRAAVREVRILNGSRLARLDDAQALLDFLSDPMVHAPIYTLPRPLDWSSVMAFIIMHVEEQTRGEGLLFVRENESGAIVGYSDIKVWPDWGVGELGGALHPSLQGKGEGTRGAAASFHWMFDALHLTRLCETASLENVATHRLLDGLGFQRMGEVTSLRMDGTTRASLVWEIAREDFKAQNARA